MEYNEAQKIKILASTFGLIVLFLVFLWLWSSFAIIKVNVTLNDNISGNIKLSYQTGESDIEDDNNSLFNIFGWSLLSREANTLTVSADGNETLVSTHSLSRFMPSIINVSISKLKNVEKVQSESLDCPVLSNNKVYSYSCSAPDNVIVYNTPTDGFWGTEIVTNIPISYYASPYLSGIAGITLEENKPIYYLNPSTKKVANYELPNELSGDTSATSNSSLVTDQTNSSTKDFLVVNHLTSKVYFSSNTGESYLSVSPPEDNNELNNVFCSLRNKTAYCYYGVNSHSPDSEEESRYKHENEGGILRVIDFSKDKPSFNDFSTGSLSIDRLLVAADGNPVAIVQNDIYVLNLDDGKFNSYLFINDINNISAGKDMYYIKNDKLYLLSLDNKYSTSKLVFKSNHTYPSSVVAYGDNVLFTSKIKDIEYLGVDTFILKNEPENESSRIKNILPLDNQSDLPIIKIDYNKDTIYVQLSINYISNRQTGETTPADKGEYEQLKKEVQSFLKDKNLDNYKVIYK